MPGNLLIHIHPMTTRKPFKHLSGIGRQRRTSYRVTSLLSIARNRLRASTLLGWFSNWLRLIATRTRDLKLTIFRISTQPTEKPVAPENITQVEPKNPGRKSTPIACRASKPTEKPIKKKKTKWASKTSKTKETDAPLELNWESHWKSEEKSLGLASLQKSQWSFDGEKLTLRRSKVL